MEKICSTCGHCGGTDSHTKGSFLIELLLWLFFILPGLIYSAWRLTTRARVCAKCGGSNLVPLDTPVGRELYAKHIGSRETASCADPATIARVISEAKTKPTAGMKVWRSN